MAAQIDLRVLWLATLWQSVVAGWYWNEGEAARVGIIVATVVSSVLIVSCMGAMVYCCMIKPMTQQGRRFTRWERYVYGEPDRVRIVKLRHGPPDIIDRTFHKAGYNEDHDRYSAYKCREERDDIEKYAAEASKQKKLLPVQDSDSLTHHGRWKEHQQEPRRLAEPRLASMLQRQQTTERPAAAEEAAPTAEESSHMTVAPPPYDSHANQQLLPSRIHSAAQTTASAIRDARRREHTRDTGVMAKLVKPRTKRNEERRVGKSKRSASASATRKEKGSGGKRTSSSGAPVRARLLYSTTKGTQTAAFPR